MRSSLLVLGAIASLANAHNGGLEGMPRLFGRDAIADLKARNAFVGQPSAPKAAAPKLEKRQNTSGRCGQGFGNCAAGYCCSGAGYCGNTIEYCAAPDCQFNYGPGCDANKIPSGASTASVPRPKLGNVAYGGAGIYNCLKAGTVALTFDDGPYTYTNDMLNVLAQYNAKATFFITGNNLGKGAIDTNWASVVTRMHTDGHQVASHTWSHQDLSVITSQQRQNQMVYNEMAIRNILGFFPTYMRPPYSSCNTACANDLKNLGYVISYFDLDTDDYQNTTPQLIQNAKNNFQGNLTTRSPTNGDWLAIAHDIHEQTAHNLTAFMLSTLYNAGYKAVTMGECLNDPPQNWYRTPGVTPTSTASSTPSSTGLPPSTDGSCGNGVTCQGSQFGNCCSQYGWCGSTDAYCGAGCNSQFGTCSSSPSPSSSSGGTQPTGTPVSTDGHCGNGVTCQGSAFGNCCSQYGWCGTTVDHCTTGCQPAFGTCSVSSSVSSAPGSSQPSSTRASSSAPASSQQSSSSRPSSSSSSTRPASSSSSTRPASSSSTRPASSSSTRPASSSSTRPASSAAAAPTASSKPVSTNGMCGDRAGKTTCTGSRFGKCCSTLGFCSNDSVTCRFMCDPAYGTCN